MINMYTEDGSKSSVSRFKFDTTSKDFHLYSRRGYKKGEQVFVDYGRKTNADFLALYGFVFPNNDGDAFILELPSLSLTPQKMSFIDLYGLPTRYVLETEYRENRGKGMPYVHENEKKGERRKLTLSITRGEKIAVSEC
jgi:hypothetical protein